MNDRSSSVPAAIADSAFVATEDSLWLMADEKFTPIREHEFESLFSVSNGYLGKRGAIPLGVPLSAPTIFIAGVFDVIPPSHLPDLAALRDWTLLSQRVDSRRVPLESLTIDEHRRMLDMRQGTFRRVLRYSDKEGRSTRISFLRVASMADRHCLLQSTLLTPENYSGPLAIRSGFLRSPASAGKTSVCHAITSKTQLEPIHLLIEKTRTGIDIVLAVAARFSAASDGVPTPEVRRTTHRTNDLMEMNVETGITYRIDWLEVCYTSRDAERPAHAAVVHLKRLLQEGVQPALRRHVDTWHQRWRTADVEIAADDDAQRAIRFACYHLMSAANPEDERVSIGAKALTGPAYKGHVFWDTEIYLLPFYTLTDPPSARALLMYRYHTLAAARDKARKHGYRGALYAWESADTGEDVTPSYTITPTGKVVPVLTGMQEHHISADVAYAVWQYWEATGDDRFLCDAGAEMLIETARFWASRGRIEADGRYHIRTVIGPDEYHEGVDDNAYTNWMAQWNLERAAAAAQLLRERWPERWRQLVQRIALDEKEPEQWLAIGARMYTGVDSERGLIEQFDGYFELEEIDLEQYAPRSMPIDLILGRERTQGAKIIKQADVVMLLHLLWERIPATMRESCFRYYEPRTEHGSSLSPSMHALMAARLGDTATAARYFRQAREIDLADNMGNASGGVHIASLGGLWQAVVFGFAGLRLGEEGLAFMPHCPAEWRCVRFPLLWRGRKIRVQIEPASMTVELLDGASLPVTVGDTAMIRLGRDRTSRWELHQGSWIEAAHECR